MRTMLKVKFPIQASNAAIKDGRFQKTMETVMQRLKPEAAYFTTIDGCRGGYIFFNLEESSDLPYIAEELFMNMDASIEVQPAMNPDDLQKGLAKAFPGR